MKCREATRTLSEGQERPLALGERVTLKLHLAMCSSCRNFGRQVAFMRESMRAYAQRPDGATDADRDTNQ